MIRIISAVGLAAVICAGTSAAQTPAEPGSITMDDVRLTHAVLVAGKPVPAGTYRVRVLSERPPAFAGQATDAQRWVEFLSGDTVIGRDVAEVISGDVAAVGTSGNVRRAPRVEMLKGGEFVRVSIYREGERYAIHLPVAP